MIRILVIGLGQWGKLWINDIQANSNYFLEAVVDNEVSTVDSVCETYKVDRARGFSSLKSALDNTSPDAAVITVPPNQHLVVAKELIDARCHILSEKPLAASIMEAKELYGLTAKASVIFMVSQDYRWQPPIQSLKEQLEMDKIGQPGYAIYTHFQSLKIGGWREAMDNVILEDMAIHHFDIIRAITGLNCIEVYAKSFNPFWSWYEGGATTSVELSFENNFHVTYFATWVTTGMKNSWPGEIRLEGSKGSLMMGADGQIYLFYDEKTQLVPLKKMPITGRQYSLNELKLAVEKCITPETRIEDNIQSFAITEAAAISARENRPVKIEDILN